jgi:hypothetical protein
LFVCFSTSMLKFSIAQTIELMRLACLCLASAQVSQAGASSLPCLRFLACLLVNFCSGVALVVYFSLVGTVLFGQWFVLLGCCANRNEFSGVEI